MIALVALAIGVMLLAGVVRMICRSDLVPVLVIGGVAAVFGYSSSDGEPVFVGNGGLNIGAALFAAVLAILLGAIGAILGRLRLVRVLLLVSAAGILFGDVAGWLHRSAGPSKYDYPAGRIISSPRSVVL
jgi:hypothetical protein